MQKKIFTIPNIISFCRILIIIFAARELYIGNNINSFILYLTAGLTDFLDGYLARKLNQISELGKMLDPIADKLMIGTAVIILLIQARMPIWYVSIIVARDLFNLLGGLWVSRKIKFVLPSVLIGKIAAVITMATFMLNILNVWFIEYLYYASVILLLVSSLIYAKIALNEIKIRSTE
ncbi:MAG: CDP-alcohol phosphatidyltransferase family protein [Ignavibacteria bacterium]|jgi:CDP-diacylglycerol--glycerol-3-phosphate 3-phosphatidyltransferase|nr:CDP-alcohol phosphatidyltransferase family protein [Ignavibacteria bacterium]